MITFFSHFGTDRIFLGEYLKYLKYMWNTEKESRAIWENSLCWQSIEFIINLNLSEREIES